jgi:Family of unknown function (DUF6221)
MTDDAVAWLRKQIEGDRDAAQIISSGGYAPERWDTDPRGQVNPGEMPQAHSITLLLDPEADDPAFPRSEYWTALYAWEKENHEPEDARVRESDMPVVIVNNGRCELHHISRHDPVNVVADCEAKLDLLRMCEPLSEAQADRQSNEVNAEHEVWSGLILRKLASAYRHRDGYAEHWG